MSNTTTVSPITSATRALCEQIAQDSNYLALQASIERFLNDDSAKKQYQEVHERGEALHHKQHAGMELSAEEIREFESARDALFKNEVAVEFLEAQQEMEAMKKEIVKYVTLTMEMGRVPTESEVDEASNGGGCCGGGCGCN